MHKDDILLKFNEEFHNKFAMQECDVMFFFNRLEAIHAIRYTFTSEYTCTCMKDHNMFEPRRKI